MNFKSRHELKVNIDDWWVFLLWSYHPFGQVVQERMEWCEENIKSPYALWHTGIDPAKTSLAYYISIEDDADAVAYKLRWT